MIRYCRVCGKEYESCYSCEAGHSWRTLTDTVEHYYILGVLMDYQSGHDAKRANRALRKRGVDLRATEGFLPSVQKLMGEIYAATHENSSAKAAIFEQEPKAEEVAPQEDFTAQMEDGKQK